MLSFTFTICWYCVSCSRYESFAPSARKYFCASSLFFFCLRWSFPFGRFEREKSIYPSFHGKNVTWNVIACRNLWLQMLLLVCLMLVSSEMQKYGEMQLHLLPVYMHDRNMLHGPWKEATSPILTLNIDDKNVNPEAIATSLAYLYGHHPKLNDSNAFRVLAAASFLDLQVQNLDSSIYFIQGPQRHNSILNSFL